MHRPWRHREQQQGAAGAGAAVRGADGSTPPTTGWRPQQEQKLQQQKKEKEEEEQHPEEEVSCVGKQSVAGTSDEKSSSVSPPSASTCIGSTPNSIHTDDANPPTAQGEGAGAQSDAQPEGGDGGDEAEGKGTAAVAAPLEVVGGATAVEEAEPTATAAAVEPAAVEPAERTLSVDGRVGKETSATAAAGQQQGGNEQEEQGRKRERGEGQPEAAAVPPTGASDAAAVEDGKPPKRKGRRKAAAGSEENRLSSDSATYQMGHEIGRGGFGTVFQALNVDRGAWVAVKRTALSNIDAESLAAITLEITLLKKLNHINIVQYIDTIQTEHYLYIVLEIMESSLAEMCKKFGCFSESLCAIYMTQVLEGLKYLHEQGVLHRDIKGANILTTKDGLVKLADFGVALNLGDPTIRVPIGADSAPLVSTGTGPLPICLSLPLNGTDYRLRV